MDDEDEKNLPPPNDKFEIVSVPLGSDQTIEVHHKTNLSNVLTQSMTIRFDQEGKYLAQGCHDGKIRIWNVNTGNESYVLNKDMEHPMPTMMVRWRPHQQERNKNVLLAVNADGSLQHWHMTSGK